VIIAARRLAHLPGMTAALTDLPVLGVPVRNKTLDGLIPARSRRCQRRASGRWRWAKPGRATPG
jgi:hypothetical protein